MEIVRIGHSCFKITGKNITVVCDPYEPEKMGLKMPKTEADVLLVSHSHWDHSYKDAIKGDFLLLDSPGQYEVKESNFEGIDSFHDEMKGEDRGHNTIFTMEIESIRLCHLGDLGAELTSEQLENIDGVDILMIPVGGEFTIDAQTAIKIINDIEPRIVIPMHYKEGKLAQLGTLEKFLGEIGEEAQRLDRLKIVKKDLPEEGMKVVVLG